MYFGFTGFSVMFPCAILRGDFIMLALIFPPLWRGDGITVALRLCGAGYCLCDSNSVAQYPIATLSGVRVYYGSNGSTLA
ncbi:hypothetical protein RchiOBHm_Chr4g0406351 [Rosa chinensis]|uniref:Uncharacterized protein n=1 Tax=Rosa chinensis TaxID=74649 RepID=A0A2P6QUB0_ROSCH|nr:hypothetical protein RchiOBHm_Chr4g0406351 [Rosa chinensis]